MLTIFATTLHRCIGANDLSGRLGGEEFAILVPGADEDAAAALGERIRATFAQAATELDGRAIAATVSIGVAASRVGDLTGLLGRADSALYRAKQEGRNRVAVFAPDRAVDEAPLVPTAPPEPIRLRAVG